MVTSNVAVKTLDDIEVIYARHVGDYQDCMPAWEKISEFATKNNLYSKTTRAIGVCHDNPEQVKDCRYDACIVIEEEVDVENDPNIMTRTIPSDQYLYISHQGSYANLHESYIKLYQHAIENNMLIADKPVLEIYLNSPMDTAEEDLLTEIYIPLQLN